MNHSALIYSHSVSPRLHYVVDFLEQYFGCSFKLVCDEEIYIAATDNCKINYGYHRLSEGEIFIHSHVLLFESAVRPVKIECFERDGYKAFFKTEGEEGFDLFAGIFYLLTRYEEYLPHRKDSYGRYDHSNSVASREGFLHLPLVNIWLEDFRKLLSERNGEFSKRVKQFSFFPTYDIDMAWVFRNKGFKRNIGGTILFLLKGQLQKMMLRIRVLQGKAKDPYDAYDWMDQIHREYGLNPIYFFLVARATGRFDKNNDTTDPEFRQLIKSTASKYHVGIHPSWASGDHPSLLTGEKTTLEEITAKRITASRQHFIRFSLPVTYQHLVALGITDDYSMGYGTCNGFRASVTTPYYWYDLRNEEKTKLLVHPFCFMDANCYYEEKSSAEAAAEQMMQYYEIVQKVNGNMITIWHNSFLGTAEEFSGWKEAYARTVAQIAERSRS